MGSRIEEITSEQLIKDGTEESIVNFVKNYELLIENIKELKGEIKNEIK